MSSIGEGQEARILSAVYGLVIARVQARLPAGKRGLRALEPISDRVPEAVRRALDDVVDAIATEVEREVESAEPFAPEEEPS
jgi:hypothetical protein